LATRFRAAWDQAARGGEVLHAWATGALLHGVEHHEAEDCPNTGDGLEPLEGMRLVVLGGLQDGALQVLAQCSVLGEARQSDCDGFLPRRRMHALGPPVAVGFGGDVLADLGQGAVAMGMWHVRSKRSALAQQMRTPPQEGTGGAHRSRRDVCLWQPPPAQPRGNLVGIARVVWGFPAVDGFPGEGMPQHTGHPLLRPAVGQPVPGEETCDCHHPAVTLGRNGRETRFRSGLHGAGPQDFPVMGHATDRPAPGMQVDTAVQWVLLGVASPAGSSS
jgi:hypothetical protein